MNEHPFSRIEFKILAMVAFVVIVIITLFAYYHSVERHKAVIEQHKAAIAAKPELTRLSKGWHLVKMQEGKEQILRIVSCYQDKNCITLGYHWDANDSQDVADAEKTYNYFVDPPPTKVLQVIH